MLIDFSFKNYKSYAGNCDFTMRSCKDKSHLENLISLKKDRISKARIIYGANASGKSSFIDAMRFVKAFAANSNHLVEGDKIQVTPFKFRKNAYKVPSEFIISFIKKGIKYKYSFSCTQDLVINEKLDVYESAKPTNIFSRVNVDEYRFSSDSRVLNSIRKRNTNNKLFLLTAATWNYNRVNPVVDFLFNDIIFLNDYNRPPEFYLDNIINDGLLKEYQDFCIEFLNRADINITDFEIDARKLKELGEEADNFRKVVSVMCGNNKRVIDVINNSNIYNFKTRHIVSPNDKNETYSLNLDEESLGTQQLFNIAPILFYVFKEGKTLFVDEIDRSLHPLLVKYLIGMFFNKNINKKSAQLICNTHDTNLLDLDFFRRDEIWFTEKNYKTGSSEMFSLSDFSPRREENIERAYLLGRYGGVPYLEDF